MTISENIFRIMKERGISQMELSRRTGITQSTISDWKRKNNNPSADKLLIICEALNVDIDTLINVKGNIQPIDYIVSYPGTEEFLLIELFRKMDVPTRTNIIEIAKRVVNNSGN